jgi:LuxR family maltose regulon positive regulatory protein
MFTDIQGYTALMQQDEQKAIQYRDKHRRIFNSVTEKYQGKVLQYYGDGTLSIFDSAIDAVQCAIEMQLGFRKDLAIPVRIGIHTGEIVFSEEEIIGDSVNVASRIESLAVPGSVFISGKVYDEIKNQPSIQTTRLKAFRLKNIAGPVEVYAVSNEGLVVPNLEDISGKTEPDPAAGQTAQTPDPSLRQPGERPFLATKLFIPPLRAGAVRRPRLIDRMNQGLNGKLILISAPPGFGKTTLVSEWVASVERPVAWLSLDEADGDPNRFLAYLVAALQTITEKTGAKALALLQSPQPPPVESILTTFLNDLMIIPEPLALVLDDYHVINAPAVDQALTFLLDHLPPQMTIAMTTREDPNLPLPRLRVRGQLTEIRAADLRFTPAEATGFFNQTMGLQLTAADIDALENRTEGWIAGLQMAALSMQGRTDAADFIRAFTGSHHFVLDYLVEEVLHRQPEDIRRFLTETAILDRLCGPLCDAVTGRADGAGVLEMLERGNLFVVPLDNQRRWYRYHHLFADVLRARVHEAGAERRAVLHGRASEWYERNGFPAEAIHHALAAGDLDRAAALIEIAWPAMDGQFQSATWLDWARALPDKWVRRRPVLSAAYAWAFLNAGELEAGEAWLQDAERQLATPAKEMVVADEEQFRFLQASIDTARAYIAQARGDSATTVRHARRALESLPEDEYVRRGPAAALLGLTYWANGDLAAAHRALTEAMNDFRLAGSIEFALSGTYGLADIRLAQGRLREAIHTYKRSLQLAQEMNGPVPRGTTDLYSGLGDLYREQGDLEAADRQLAKSEELGEETALPDWPSRFHQILARMKAARGDLYGALELLDEAERLYFRSPVPEARPIAAQRARLWVKQGRLAEALDWARERGLSADDELSFLQEFEHLTLASILIARYRRDGEHSFIEKALDLLERLRQAAETSERMGNLIEVLIQQAIAHEVQDNLPAAVASLERALTLAEPEGYVRIFVDEGRPMSKLLREVAARRAGWDYPGKLLAALGEKSPAAPARQPVRAAQPLVEPLSERELEILELIAQGLSNKEISRRLYVTLSTVKGHNQNIFGKLGVKRRTEAVARARALGVL